MQKIIVFQSELFLKQSIMTMKHTTFFNMKEMIRLLDGRISLEKESLTDAKVALPGIIFAVVGMRFYGDHRFSETDIICLEKKDGSHPIRVMIVEKTGKRHVAHVAKDDAVRLKVLVDLEEKEIVFIRHFKASAELICLA